MWSIFTGWQDVDPIDQPWRGMVSQTSMPEEPGEALTLLGELSEAEQAHVVRTLRAVAAVQTGGASFGHGYALLVEGLRALEAPPPPDWSGSGLWRPNCQEALFRLGTMVLEALVRQSLEADSTCRPELEHSIAAALREPGPAKARSGDLFRYLAIEAFTHFRILVSPRTDATKDTQSLKQKLARGLILGILSDPRPLDEQERPGDDALFLGLRGAWATEADWILEQLADRSHALERRRELAESCLRADLRQRALALIEPEPPPAPAPRSSPTSSQTLRFARTADQALIELAMEVPLGEPMFRMISRVHVPHTGVDEYRITLARGSEPEIVTVRGPTLSGLGPAVARTELERLRFLQAEIEQAVARAEAFLGIVQDAPTPTPRPRGRARPRTRAVPTWSPGGGPLQAQTRLPKAPSITPTPPPGPIRTTIHENAVGRLGSQRVPMTNPMPRYRHRLPSGVTVELPACMLLLPDATWVVAGSEVAAGGRRWRVVRVDVSEASGESSVTLETL